MTTTKKVPAKTALMKVLEDLLHKKSFQKISVNELCESAKISRSAFYANFEDKYQLLSYCLNTKAEEFNSLMEFHSPQEFLTVMLDFIQKEGKFFYNTFNTDLNEEMREIFYHFFDQHFTNALKEKEAQGFVLPGPAEVVSSFYIGGLTNTIVRWIKSNYQIPKSELAACQYRLLKDIF